MLTLVQHQSQCAEMEPHFALCFSGRFSEELSALDAPTYPLGNVRLSRPFSVRRARRKLQEMLLRKDFDVVVVHSAWSLAIFGPVVRSFQKPLVFWLHDVPDGMPWPERWARWTRPPELVICNSKYTLERLPKLYPRIRSKVVYCPVAPPPTAYSDGDLKKLRDEFQTPADAVVVLQISRLEAHKGHLVHLEALGRLRDLPNWVCWQVGDVQKPSEIRYFEQVKETAQRLGIDDRVRFLGWQPDVQKVIAASDIYCQPNIYPEPFGITFIEALYAGKPVIGTSLGGPKEIIDDSCGFLVPPNDVIRLDDTLRKLIVDARLRNGLGSAGPLRAQKLCDPATQMQTLHKALSSVSRNELN